MQYFSELLEINKKIIPGNDNIRILDLEDVYSKLNDFYSKEFDLDEFIKLCIILFNMQIFYDGNSRTILTYLANVIDKYGYYIDTDKATEGLIKLKGLFPVMYDLNEDLDGNEIFIIKQFIYKKNNRKRR